MDAPDELRYEIREVLADHFPMTPYHRVDRAADAILAVPAIADALAARVEGAMTKDEYLAASQRWVDEVCYYRNLAIASGAKPNEMLNGTDRKLCEAGRSIVEPFDERTEIIELWGVADNAEAALARDAKVAEIVAEPVTMRYWTMNRYNRIAALYPEAGRPPRSSMDDDGERA